MAANPYLNFDLSINRKEVFRRAWAAARRDLAIDFTLGHATTLRECFAAALRKQWDMARGYRANAVFIAERDAALAVVSPRDRAIFAAEQAVALAPMIDSTRESFRVRDEAVRQLTELRLAA